MKTRLPAPYQPAYYEGAKGPFLVLEGVSGIGKSTLARLLAGRLNATGLHTLPAPHSEWSTMINSRLRALPQFGYYLSGVLHASDSIRQTRMIGPVIADRYVSSVIACHAAVHGVDIDTVTRLLEPFRDYLEAPTRTFYLRCSEEQLRERLATKQDIKSDDTDLLKVPDRLTWLLHNFEQVAASDPSAVWLDTDGRTPDDLAVWILTQLETPSA
ncbi:dTMP kinase [Streptomyces inhibens]|uniref:dTMP kinase n=1 Tax=Streptomyces inhibens TaxID=2293571 RepID=UPI001EE74FED|nr:thymidylate kinase [Streptomyces inhibens]UKY49228.1 thymidylate kinase [Streptomyces inhibens]